MSSLRDPANDKGGRLLSEIGSWTIESLDWTSGGNHFRKYIGVLPRWNSFYAATQLTGDGSVIYGTYNGVAYVPKR